jgi:hypothetical protein
MVSKRVPAKKAAKRAPAKKATKQTSASRQGGNASKLIDSKIKELGDW